MYKHLFYLLTLLFACNVFADTREKVSSWGGGLQDNCDTTLPWGKKPVEEKEKPKPRKEEQEPVYNSQVRVGGNYAYVWMTPELEDTLQGSLGGAQGIYEYRPSSGIYEALKGTYRQGRMSFHDTEKRDLLDLGAEGRIGYTGQYCRFETRATFFTGFGYRYLGQEVVGPLNSNFNYNELYVPVGFLIDRCVRKHYRVGVNLTWMAQVFTFVDVTPDSDIDYRTNRRFYNFLVEVPISYISKHWIVELKPFVQYWQDGLSTAAGTPLNTYIFAGGELNVGYAF